MEQNTHHKVLFIFLDGIGLAPRSPENPMGTASMPFLHSLLGGPLCEETRGCRNAILLKGLDACLGVKGVPQSATGQTALLTGVNAAGFLGFHLPAFPNQKLVDIIKKQNILSQAVAAGFRAIFANSYSPLYFKLIEEKKRRHSVTTHCMLAAGIPFRNMRDLRAGRAVHWDMTRESLARYEQNPPPVINHYMAGTHLAAITAEFDLVVYESFLSDMIGHSRSMQKAENFLGHLDTFLKGVVDHLGQEVTLVLSSDHGNLEDLSTTQHTRNPVPLLVYGKAAATFSHARSITDVTPAVVKLLAST